MSTSETDKHSVNISWSATSPQTMLDIPQKFVLTISYAGIYSQISLYDTYYIFTAAEDAPPCEVYNFSVTATYVGATYTGAGCNIPSQVLSRMLPSLPKVNPVESSLSYSLLKLTKPFGYVLIAFFEVRKS